MHMCALECTTALFGVVAKTRLGRFQGEKCERNGFPEGLIVVSRLCPQISHRKRYRALIFSQTLNRNCLCLCLCGRGIPLSKRVTSQCMFHTLIIRNFHHNSHTANVTNRMSSQFNFKRHLCTKILTDPNVIRILQRQFRQLSNVKPVRTCQKQLTNSKTNNVACRFFQHSKQTPLSPRM